MFTVSTKIIKRILILVECLSRSVSLDQLPEISRPPEGHPAAPAPS